MKQMRGMFQSLSTKFKQFQSETFFISTGIPGLIGPMATLNNTMASFKAMQLSGNALKKGAVTACECARSVCKPVDDLFKRPSSPLAYSNTPTYTQTQYAPVLQPMYQVSMPPMIDPSADNALG